MPDTRHTHGFKVDTALCNGCMDCMRACPTQAIRVKEGKATLLQNFCIDCGQCLTVCPSGAIGAITLSIEELDRFKYKVAVPSSVLYSQFPTCDMPHHINQALLNLGFDEVWDFSLEIMMVTRAIGDCLKTWRNNFPLISGFCPVIVRLIQVAYPTMVNQIIPIDSPRELAARELKRKNAERLGLSENDIAAIYITPCQAKTISILQPAENADSNLDGAIGINEIYNELLFSMRESEKSSEKDLNRVSGSNSLLEWGTPTSQSLGLLKHNCLSLTGLTNVISVFNDVEKGKIRDVEFLECYACQGGCVGGNLTVDNLYMARSKILHLIGQKHAIPHEIKEEVERRYSTENISLKAPLKPRGVDDVDGDLLQRVQRRQHVTEILEKLPGLNCGLCGAPNCKTHSEDVAAGKHHLNDCVFLSNERVKLLQKLYLQNKSKGVEEPDQDQGRD